MASRNDFDDFFGDDEDVPVTDTRADGRLYRVPLTRLSPNLVNPRTDFGTEDALIDFGKSLQRRQNQACPVVSRNAYLKLWPDHRDQVKDVDYILVSGERRYRAANAVGLAVLDCVVNDDFAADRKTFMEAVVSENVDRQNFDPVEEAYAVQALVAEFGSNRAVAQHFERVDGWVTQRILLTHLAREVQAVVRTKKMPLEAARQLGKLTKDRGWDAREQLAWWGEEQERRLAASAARAAARRSGSPAPPQPAGRSFTAVKQEGPLPGRPEPEKRPGAVPPSPPSGFPPKTPTDTGSHNDGTDKQDDHAASPATSAVPEPRPELITEGHKLPYNNGTVIAKHLILKMPPDELAKMLRLLNQHAERNALQPSASAG